MVKLIPIIKYFFILFSCEQKVQNMSSRIVKEEEKLFYYMHFARKKSRGIEKYAIYLIGEIRSGKSTTFNWILNAESIIGKKSSGKVQYIRRQGLQYEDIFQTIKDSFVSVSLVPNMKKLRKKQIDFSLIDLPGFHDSRTSSERMLVNFINNTCFSHTAYAKFILVISEADFIHPTGLGLTNAIKEFVKLFKQFPSSERAKVFQSVGMLITSVKLRDYKVEKQDHLDVLSEKLNKMKEMPENIDYYTLMEELIQSIMKDQRLELFQMAKDGLSPSSSTLIEDFKSCGWTFYDLKNHKEDISYPYQQYYQSLRLEEQGKINAQIASKIRQFQEIQRCMASIIGNYLKGLTEQKEQYYEYDQIFSQLEKILDRNRVEHRQRQIIEEEVRRNQAPLRICKNILSLLDITYEIQDDKERPIEDQKIHYLTYLGSYFNKSIKIFSQSFALTQKHHQIISELGQVFLEIMEELKYIVQIDRTLESEYSRLKQSIQIMNGIQLIKDQIQQSFVVYLKKEHFEDLEGCLYEQQVLDQVIQFLKCLNWINFNLQDQFYISRKVYHARGLLMTQLNKQKSISYYLTCLESNLKLFLLNFREQDGSRMQKSYQQKIQDIEIYFKELMEDIFVLLYLIKKPEILKLLKEKNFLFLMKQSYSKLQKFFEGKSVNILLRDYGICYLEGGYYSHAIGVFKKLQRNSKNDRIEAQRMLESAKKQKAENHQNIFLQYNYCENIEQFIELINIINEIVSINPVRYDKKKMLEEFSELSKKKCQKMNQNQFDYTLLRQPDYIDIITISKHLIQKINNRKVILMFGKHAGKSTAFYWLQNKQLVCKHVGKNKYIFDLSKKYLNENRINHCGFSPTFIPNIGCVGQDEILIDFPNIFESKIINVMIKLEMLSMIVRNSKDIKFLLVIKQEDLTINQCVELFQMFTFLLKILPEKKDIYRHFSLLISYSNDSNEKTVKQILRDFSLEFGKDEANVTDYSEKFEEKYRIKLQDKQIYKEVIDYFALQSSIIFFQKANKSQQNPSINFEEFRKQDENWKFLESSSIKTTGILSWIVTVSQQYQQVMKIQKMIMANIQTVKHLLSLIQVITSKIVKQEKMEESFLQNEVGKQFIEKWKAAESSESKILPQLLILNKIFILKSLMQFYQRLEGYFTNFAEFNSIISEFFDLIKKLALGQTNYLILASWAGMKLKQIFTLFGFIENFYNNLSNIQIGTIREKLSCFYYIVNLLANNIYQRFNGTIITLFQKINLEKLIGQMIETKIYTSENLLRLINTFQKIQNWDSGLFDKWKRVVDKFWQLSQKELNPINQLNSQIILFEQFKMNFQAKQEQFEYKLSMIKIIARTTIICAPSYQQFGLRIAKLLKCDKTLQRFIDELAKQNNHVQFLKQLMELCLSVGYSQKYYQLLIIYVEKSEDESEKNRYKTIRNQIVEKQVIKKRISYDNMHNYTIQDLENICEEIKQFWLEQRNK